MAASAARSEAIQAGLLGPGMVLVFCFSQAFRDVYFANVFQGVDYFAVILVSFGVSTLIFGAIAAARAPSEFTRMRGHWPDVLAMNVTTALAWTSYFYALKHMEPSVVNTVHSGVAPLTVVALGALGFRLAKRGRLTRLEYACYAGIAFSLAALGWVVLSGQSGVRNGSTASNALGLALLLVSGSSITVSLLYSKRLHDHGIGAEAVTAVRYVAIILLAAGVMTHEGGVQGMATLGDWLFLSLAGTVLIVLPVFALQVGVERTAPLTAQVIRALGPVLVFALQQFDGRLAYSPATLACVLSYSFFAVASNLAHGWRDKPASD
jgi:drug/metabolite transporter (DMT)-like permease